jgi:hypothetical protein
MATETLRLDIVADSAQAKAELQKLNNQLAIFERAVKKATDPAQIQYLNRNIEFLRGNIQTATTANQKFATGSNQAANALTNLGRVAQDAPFGFIGIQNNLNPLLESFQRLKAESKTNGQALKALAGSLIGPAGLGLALSVASSLLLVFGDRLFKSAQETEKATKFNESYTNSLAKERTQLDSLFQAATNANAPLLARKDAVKELRDNYGAYLKNFSDEEILAGKAATAYTELANAIVMASKARAAQDAIVELQKKSITAEIKLQEIATKAQQDAAKARDIAARGTQGGFTRAITAEQQRIGIFANAQMEAKKLAEEIAGINKEINQYAAIASSNQIKPFTEDTVRNVNNQTDAVKKLTAAQLAQLALEKKIAEARAGFGGAIDGGAAITGNTPTNTSFQAVGPNDAMVQRSLAVQEATKRQLDYANALRLTTMNEEAAAAMSNIATSALTSLGNAMLMGQDMGEALGNVFRKLIIDLTQMVVRALLFKAILASLSGGTSEVLAGGASGGGFLNFFKGLMGFADGGIASGPKSGYPVMLHGTEAVLNPKQFKNLTSNMMNLGAAQGGGAMNLQGEFIVRGQDLVYILNSTNRNNGLLGR